MGVCCSAVAVPLLYPLAGGSWSSSLFFYEYLPDGRVILGEYKQSTIRTQLLPLLGSSDSVESLTVYKSRLLFPTSTQMSVYHTFLIAKTPNWCYSLEKNMLGLVLQRSTLREDVLQRIENVSRKVDTLTLQGERLHFSGPLPFGRIIEWIQMNGELGKRYSFLGNNCQLFVGHFKDAFVDSNWNTKS